MPAGICGFGLVFLMFPVAHAVVQACFDRHLIALVGTGFLILGLLLVVWSLRAPTEATQAILGLLAGFLLWAAVGEVPHVTGRGLHVGPENGGLLLAIGACFWLSRPSPERSGVRIALEFFLIVWALHVVLLTAYYDPRFGVTSGLTYGIFGIAVVLIPVLWRWVARITELGRGIRAGVVTASVLWTAVEILMKWGWLPKPWKPMNPWVITACAVALGFWWRYSVMSVENGRPQAVPRPPRR